MTSQRYHIKWNILSRKTQNSLIKVYKLHISCFAFWLFYNYIISKNILFIMI